MIPKFRAWHKELERMMSVQTIWLDEGEVSELELDDSFINESILVYRDEVALMQSTGLVDKNGKEIYEGDIVHAYSEGARLIGVIEYFDNAYCIKDKNGIYNALWINAEHYEVVGNIWEDGELVEEADE
jgi:uncharacterized phage protein (TIGR01671 family)